MNIHLPISTRHLIGGEKLAKISEEMSIYENIDLILRTNLGACSYNRTFGCKLWQDDFDVEVTQTGWTTKMTQELKNNISENGVR